MVNLSIGLLLGVGGAAAIAGAKAYHRQQGGRVALRTARSRAQLAVEADGPVQALELLGEAWRALGAGSTSVHPSSAVARSEVARADADVLRAQRVIQRRLEPVSEPFPRPPPVIFV